MSVYSDYPPISVSPYVEDLSLSFWDPWENYVEPSKDTNYNDRSSHTRLWDYQGSEQQCRAFENDQRQSGWQRYTVGYQDTQHNVVSSAETSHSQSHHSNQSAHNSASLQSPQHHSQQSYEHSLPHQSYQLSSIEHHQEPHNQTELHHHQSYSHHEPHRQAEPNILPEPHCQEPQYHHEPHNQTQQNHQQHYHHTSHDHPETYYEQKHHGEQHHYNDQREHHNHHESHNKQHYDWYNSSQHQHHNQHHQREDDQRHDTQHEHRNTVHNTQTHQVDAVSSAQWERQNQQYKHGDHADNQPHPVPPPPTSSISSTVNNTEYIRVTNEPQCLVAQPVLEVESSKPADNDVSSAVCDHTLNIFIIQLYRILTMVYNYSHYKWGE